MKYSSRALSSEDKKGVAIFLAGLAILATLVTVAIRAVVAPANHYDSATLCNESVPRYAHRLFLVDVSDALSDYQKHFLRRHISSQLQDAGMNDRFTIFVLDEKYNGLSEPVVDVCKPRSGENTSALTSNRVFVDKLYRDRFEMPLEEALDDIVSGSDQAVSPIYEALSDLVALGRLDRHARDVHLTIVSDMIQNSRAGSVFSSGPDAIDALPPINLGRARTTVFWLRREKYRKYQTSELERSWEEYLASVSRLEYIEKIRN